MLSMYPFSTGDTTVSYTCPHTTVERTPRWMPSDEDEGGETCLLQCLSERGSFIEAKSNAGEWRTSIVLEDLIKTNGPPSRFFAKDTIEKTASIFQADVAVTDVANRRAAPSLDKSRAKSFTYATGPVIYSARIDIGMLGRPPSQCPGN